MILSRVDGMKNILVIHRLGNQCAKSVLDLIGKFQG